MHITHFGNWKTLVGTGACIGAATVIAVSFRNRPIESVVPLLFLAVIALVAMAFGATAGVIGSITAAGVFATLLFQPHGSFVVADLNERANLTWMCLFGLALSFLLDNIRPDDWLRLTHAVKFRVAESRDLQKRLDKTLLALLALFGGAGLLILWWVLEHPATYR